MYKLHSILMFDLNSEKWTLIYFRYIEKEILINICSDSINGTICLQINKYLFNWKKWYLNLSYHFLNWINIYQFKILRKKIWYRCCNIKLSISNIEKSLFFCHSSQNYDVLNCVNRFVFSSIKSTLKITICIAKEYWIMLLDNL